MSQPKALKGKPKRVKSLQMSAAQGGNCKLVRDVSVMLVRLGTGKLVRQMRAKDLQSGSPGFLIALEVVSANILQRPLFYWRLGGLLVQHGFLEAGRLLHLFQRTLQYADAVGQVQHVLTQGDEAEAAGGIQPCSMKGRCGGSPCWLCAPGGCHRPGIGSAWWPRKSCCPPPPGARRRCRLCGVLEAFVQTACWPSCCPAVTGRERRCRPPSAAPCSPST